MFKKFGIALVAVVLAVGFSAFSPAKPSTTSDGLKTQYYWYDVDLSTQKIPQNAVPFDHAADVADCPNPGASLDCSRGFLNQQNTSAGPISARGNVQKMSAQP